MTEPMGTNNRPQGGPQTPQDDPKPMMRYLRSVDNTVLWGGICAIISLFFLNTLFALAGIIFNWVALARLSSAERLFAVPADLLAKKKKTARIVMILCLVTVVIDVVLGNVLSSMLSPYLAATGGTASSLIDSLSGETSTWG